MQDQTARISLEPGQYLTRSRLEGLLAKATPAPDTPASSLYLRPGEAGSFLQAARRGESGWAAHLSEVGDAIVDSDTGIVGLQADARGLIILPPFPVAENKVLSQWDAAPRAPALSPASI